MFLQNFHQMHYFLRNYRMNIKFHHFSIRLHVLGRTTQAQLPRFTFMALYSRMLCSSYCLIAILLLFKFVEGCSVVPLICVLILLNAGHSHRICTIFPARGGLCCHCPLKQYTLLTDVHIYSIRSHFDDP